MAKLSKTKKKRLMIFGTASLIIISYFIFNLGYNVYKIYDLNREKKKLDKELVELKREAKLKELEIDKFKNNEKYIADYAREKFSYSKSGEYILKIPKQKKEDEEEKLDINIDYNYIIYGGFGALCIIFIYIIKKKK